MMTTTQQKLITAITITGLLAMWVIAHNSLDNRSLNEVFGPMKRICGL